jgi:hypothetical protein
VQNPRPQEDIEVPDKSIEQPSGQVELSRSGRAISELVMAEIFFIQATIESATALGDGLGTLRRRLGARDAAAGSGAGSGSGSGNEETLGEVLKRTRHEVVQPYSERIEMFRKLRDQDKAA